MSRILDRSIVKELGPPFAIGVAVFTFFLVIDRIYQLTDLVITKNVPFALVMPLLLYMLPSFLALTLPMATLPGSPSRSARGRAGPSSASSSASYSRAPPPGSRSARSARRSTSS